MRILITGATGLVGKALVLRLQREGHSVVCASRNPDTVASRLGPDVEAVSLAQPISELVDQLGHLDGVVNLAGEPIVGKRWTKKQRIRLVESRVDLTQRLVNVLRQIPHRPKVLVSASAVGYYGTNVDSSCVESSPPGEGFIPTLCRSWERAADRARDFEVRVVQPRIGIVLSKEGGVLAKLMPLFRLGLGGPLGRGQQMVPWIHIDDLVSVLMRCLQDESLEGPVNAVGPQPVSNKAFSQALGSALERPSWLPAPRPALYLALGRQAQVVLAGQHVLPARLQQLGFDFKHERLSDALVDLLCSQPTSCIAQPTSLPDSEYLRKRGAKYELVQETLVNAPLQDVFDFFSRAENLGLMTPSSVQFKITSPMPETMHEGAEIAYKLRIAGLPVRWRTRIEHWQRGPDSARFVDIQLKGPYRSWWHEHTFEAIDGQTKMTDRVLYKLPLGPLGRAAHALRVRHMLRDIFEFRDRTIHKRFGTATPAAGWAPVRRSA